MALFDRISQALALAPFGEPIAPPPLERLEQRDLPPPDPEGSLADLINRLRGSRELPWRTASVSEALGVPAIFRAVTLISNTIGALSMRAFRAGAELPTEDRPRLIVRPNPFTTAREFYREAAYSMAAYGEGWLWVAARDTDDMAISLIPVHPREVQVTENPADLRYPLIYWRGKLMPNRDMIQVKMTGEPGALRGYGPLQRCGAAVSIAVEAQEWAANYFAIGGIPSVLVKTSVDMTDQEAQEFKAAWVATPPNMPKIADPTVAEVQELGANVDGAQMIGARDWQNGDAARMFGIPGTLLSYAVAGSSLTYQNVGQEFDKFIRVCLLPDYLQPLEQAITDLLPRQTTAEFNTGGLLRSDVQTLFNVATLGYEKDVLTRDEARQVVGLGPDVEQAPVPFSPPAAFPSKLGFEQRAEAEAPAREVRCTNRRLVYGRLQECGARLGRLTAGSVAYCHKCKAEVAVGAPAVTETRRVIERDAEGRIAAIVERVG